MQYYPGYVAISYFIYYRWIVITWRSSTSAHKVANRRPRVFRTRSWNEARCDCSWVVLKPLQASCIADSPMLLKYEVKIFSVRETCYGYTRTRETHRRTGTWTWAGTDLHARNIYALPEWVRVMKSVCKRTKITWKTKTFTISTSNKNAIIPELYWKIAYSTWPLAGQC